MATGEIKVKVAVEKAIHDAMREIAQTIFDEHSIVVHNVAFSYVEYSTTGQTKMLVHDVRMETETKP